jgi:DDE superfamily endonuclease
MLPFVNLPGSLLEILSAFRPCFTAPGFAAFCGLVAGLAGQVRRRTVTGMLLGACLQHRWPHDRAHRFFARARWDPDELGVAVARLAVLLLVPPGEDLRVAVDDSVFRRSGRRVHGAGWQHDGSSPARNKVSYGCCFVTAALLVRLPFCSREIGLPVLARLRLPGRYRHRGRHPDASLGPGTVEIAAALVSRLALAFPGRRLHVVADGAYHGPALRTLPPAVTWTCRIPRNAVLYGPPPPRTGRRGRPRTKGDPLGTPAAVAAAAGWDTLTAVTYRARRDTMRLADVTCLWYGSWHTRTVRLILARNPGTAAGYDLALVTTDLHASPAALITRYAARWAIEQAFADARNVLGAGEARNRTRRAVERTVPFCLLTHTIIVIWYARHGHDPADITARRHDQPWYTAKTEPAFEDMLTKLRRVLITARISGGHPGQPTTRQIQAVLTAWNAAAA